MSDLDSNWQSRVYNVAARRRFGDRDVRVSFWVLRHRVQRVWMSAGDAARDEAELAALADEIRSENNPVGRPSGLCPWCPYYQKCEDRRKSVKERMAARHG
jgi:hypothetical protein